MPEMIITTPIVKKVLDDYDIIYENGMLLPLTIDLVAGDTLTITDTVIKAHLVPKPSQNDPTKILPAEDITVFISKVASIQHRVREVVEQTPEEKAQWHKTFQEMVGPPTVM